MQACIYVEAGAFRFHLDCGASSLIAMHRFGVDPPLVDAIFLTHLHGDHFGGIPFFLLDAHLISKRTAPLVVAGPPGLEERIRETMEALFPGSSAISRRFEISFVELMDGVTTTIGGVELTPYAVLHESGAPAYALRTRYRDKVVAYSGDTAWTDALVRASDGADLFVCEAYFFEKEVKYHLDYRTLMTNRWRLGCRRLVITHMNADLLERLQDLATESASDGYEIIL